MRRRWLKRLQGIVGVILILTAIGAMYLWETYGRDRFLSQEIVVLNQNIKRNTIITEDMLAFEKRAKETLIENCITTKEEVIGLSAKHYIPKGLALDKDFFEDDKLILKEDEYVFSIPDSWILAIPGSLRRGDEITFYPILMNENKLLQSIEEDKEENQTINENETMSITDNETKENNPYGLINIEVEVKENDKESLTIKDEKDIKEMIKEFEDALPTFTFYTIHVKDGSNREVVTVDMYGDDKRFDASSTISEVEIITTKDKVKAMSELIEKGYQYLVMYEE